MFPLLLSLNLNRRRTRNPSNPSLGNSSFVSVGWKSNMSPWRASSSLSINVRLTPINKSFGSCRVRPPSCNSLRLQSNTINKSARILSGDLLFLFYNVPTNIELTSLQKPHWTHPHPIPFMFNERRIKHSTGSSLDACSSSLYESSINI